MCDCHPMTADEKAEWRRVKDEVRTREDWMDLHDTIEQYRRRLMKRHAHVSPSEEPEGAPKA